MNKILKIDHLRKIYHTKQGETLAVGDFSFTLSEGEFVAIVGPSGCGKSTILSMLAKLEEKSGGSIQYKTGCRLGYMLQKDSLFPCRTILDNCLLGLEIHHEDNEENKKKVVTLLETYGLGEFKDSYPANLSGGMRQRVV